MEQDYRFEAFPDDERYWWIRWVDCFHNRRDKNPQVATPYIRVVLSPLSIRHLHELQSVRLDLEVQAKEFRIVSAQTGVLPALHIGAVFFGRRYVGDLPSEELRDAFSIQTIRPQLVRVNSLFEPVPYRWTPTYPYRAIREKEYPLPPMMYGASCILLRGRHLNLLVPCSEVFRTYYALSTELALALTSGPWAEQSKSLVNPARTKKIEEMRWQVCLKDTISDDYLDLIANLLFNPDGIRAANSIYTRILTQRGADSYCLAEIPFTLDKLELSVRAFPLDRRVSKYLCTIILASSTPNPDVVLVHGRDNDNTQGLEVIPTDAPPPYAGRRSRVVGERHGTELVTFEEDPNANQPSVQFAAPKTIWLDPPKRDRLAKPISKQYRGQHSGPLEDLKSKGSAGNPWHGRTESRPVRFDSVERHETPHRFDCVIQCLTDLASRKEIDGWEIVAPENITHWRGNYPVWPFPEMLSEDKPSPWSCLERSELDSRRRCALVCKLRIMGAVVYWMEIECKGTEGYKFLLFCVSDALCHAGIAQLIHLAAGERGKWPSKGDILNLTLVDDARPCQHDYGRKARKESDTKNTGPITPQKRALNAKSVTKLIHNFLFSAAGTVAPPLQAQLQTAE